VDRVEEKNRKLGDSPRTAKLKIQRRSQEKEAIVGGTDSRTGDLVGLPTQSKGGANHVKHHLQPTFTKEFVQILGGDPASVTAAAK